MKRIEIEKNRLDLAYQRNLQLLNTLLIMGFGSIITYLVALILDTSKSFQYTIILVIISSISILLYRRINNHLKKISDEIGKLV
ncbi:hypothetical protein HYW75_06065 [Candidatus Pacearchaeota archaeon]|nr:hypothetical protein [Candidatus Pacearchaeota archaeon]